MKVTPVKKKFGKYAPGDVFEMPDRTAKVFIKVGKLEEVRTATPTYQTRMMQAAEPVKAEAVKAEPAEEAPYGYKADGTPRKRPAPVRKKVAGK